MGGAREFGGAVKLLCMILYWWICVIIHLFKPTERKIPRVNLNVNYRFWVTVMCRFSCNKYHSGDVDNGAGGCVWEGRRGYRNYLYFLLNFSVNLELL